MRAWLLGVLLGLAALPAVAQDPHHEQVHQTLRLETEPSNLAIYRRATPHDQYLGQTGVDIPWTGTRADWEQDWTLYFVYSPQGHPSPDPQGGERAVLLRVSDRNQRYPRKGALPANLSEADRRTLFWRTQAPWWGGAGLAAVGLLGALVHTRRQAQRRSELWKEMVPDDGSDPLIGVRVDRWVLVGRLGKGGMATVYRGLPSDTLSEKEAVAIKLAEPDSVQDQEFRARWKREVQVNTRLVHRHIVKLQDYGELEGRPYLVMELIKGDTLRTQLVEGGLPPERAARLLEPIMEALAFAHGKGIVHRDLKPENVMISYEKAGEPRVVVMDFGLARSHQCQTVTVTGNVLGTPAYMAPEQINGQWEAATDQYALGVMAYEALCGRRPFAAEDPIQALLQHLQQEPAPLRSQKPSLPPALEQVVMRLLCKDPKQRFPSLDEALKAWRLALNR